MSTIPTFHYAQLPDGRFVRMRELSSEDQQVAAKAANLRISAEGLAADDAARLDLECLRLAVVGISKSQPLPKAVAGEDGKAKRQVVQAASIPSGDWRTLSPHDLAGESFDAIFGAKARRLLKFLYGQVHNASVEEFEDFFASIQTGSGSS